MVSFKVCPFSYAKCSEFSENDEKCDSIFKKLPIMENENKRLCGIGEFDWGVDFGNKKIVEQLVGLKDQVLALNKMLSNRQEDERLLVEENMDLIVSYKL